MQPREQPGRAVDVVCAHGQLERLDRDAHEVQIAGARDRAHGQSGVGGARRHCGGHREVGVCRLAALGWRLHAGLGQQPLQEQTRSAAPRAPRHPPAGQVADPAHCQRVAARHDQAHLAPPQVDQHDGLAGQQTADVGVVVAPRFGMDQMQHARVRLPARHRLQAMHAAPRTGHHFDRLAGCSDQRIERRIVAARQSQLAPARQPPARARRTVHCDPRSSAIARGDQPSPSQLAVRACHRPGRTPQLRRQRPCRGQRRARRPPPIRDLRGQCLHQVLHHLQRYRYHDRNGPQRVRIASVWTISGSAASSEPDLAALLHRGRRDSDPRFGRASVRRAKQH